VDKFILRPPSDAQFLIEACSTKPDFYYREHNAAIYIDGPPHDEPHQIRQDEANYLNRAIPFRNARTRLKPSELIHCANGRFRTDSPMGARTRTSSSSPGWQAYVFFLDLDCRKPRRLSSGWPLRGTVSNKYRKRPGMSCPPTS